MLDVGHVIGGRFEIEATLGTGVRMAYRARDRRTGAAVTVRTGGGPDDLALRLSAVGHAGLPTIVAHGDDWVAYPHRDGEDLHARLRRGAIAAAEALRIVRGAAGAVGAAHAIGVAHGQLSPFSIFLSGTDVLVTDFYGVGLSPAYAAPERIREAVDASPAADVFALGCLLFECLTGAPAFEGELPEIFRQVIEIEPRYPTPLCARLMAKDPAARPRDGREVVALIDEALR